ncbi:unnamed protein product [Mycena citricolor]|uniref:ATP-dependent DNA helicase n=1 Tax=Mycena citricolor TaxID=2018698 RepID=A0AAD2HW12_9AGAR|nr:unnamed protein product [Mycena citricolor]
MSTSPQLWSTTIVAGPWNLWITINPSDIHDPIAQVFAGERIDLDNFLSTAGPDSDERGRNIAADPYAAAKFFHFMIRLILEILFGMECSSFQARSHMGILGELAAYFGLVEGQNRASLHFHLLAALRHAPNADEMIELLKSETFRHCIIAYIKENLRAYLPGLESEASVKQLPVEKEIAYNRPPHPDASDYSAQLAAFERRVVRTEQVHTCDIRRCLVVTKSGRLRCKQRAPFQCAEEDFVHESGDWGPKRLYPYLNAWIPGVSVNVRCNNDMKFLTHGTATQSVAMYIVGYAAKPQMRHHNTSAILAKGYAYHVAHPNTMAGELVTSLRDKQQLMLFCLIHAINREQELGAPMVVSYLMGWGDRYHSHNYVPIYWTSFVSALLRAHPLLKRKRHTNNNVDVAPNPALAGGTSTEHADDEITGASNVTLQLNSAGRIFVKSQVIDYSQRGTELADYNMMDYFVDTYESDISSKERESGCQPTDEVTHDTHPSHDQKQRIIRLVGHNTFPNFIGQWFPRRDDEEDQDFYMACMLMLLKPWHVLQDDLKTIDQTWPAAFDLFYQSASPRIHDLLANIQFYHGCELAALASRNDVEELDDADQRVHSPDNDGIPALGEDALHLTDSVITEEAIQSLIDNQVSAREYSHGQFALEIARLVKIFEMDESAWNVEVVPSTIQVAPAVGSDFVKLIAWRKQLDNHLRVQNGGFSPADGTGHANDATANGQAAEPSPVAPSVERITSSTIERATLQASTYKEFSNCPSSLGSTSEPDIVLQPDQQRAYDIITWHLARSLAGDDVPPLRMLIHGEGGTGKSKVITKVTRNFEERGAKGRLIKAAYTGIAASLIDGKTTHIIGGISASGRMSDANKGKLQEFWKGYSYLIIDEISMISKDFLAQLSRNIGIGKASSSDKSFGGINVILCGDFHQFPPVATSPTQALYHPPQPGDSLNTKVGRSIYEEFTTVVILKQQMRDTDVVWLDFLRHLRVGDVQEHHLAMLRTLVIRPQDNMNTGPWKDATLVSDDLWRKVQILTSDKKVTPRHGIFICKAEDSYRGEALSMKDRYALAEHLCSKKRTKNSMKKDLVHSMELAIGMEVLVTNNIETDLDLTNGARGIIQSIVLHPDEGELGHETIVMLKKLPAYILVRFERTKAARLAGLDMGVLPIEPAKTTYRVKTTISGGAAVTKTIQRRQFPLTGAYAFTDYRSQGQTLKNVLVDIATPPSGGLSLFNVYVALSRSSGRETIRLLRDFDDATFEKGHDVALLQEDARLERDNEK